MASNLCLCKLGKSPRNFGVAVLSGVLILQRSTLRGVAETRHQLGQRGACSGS
jgi:hypothetical protein